MEKTGKHQTRGRQRQVEERAAGGVGEEQWAGPRRGGGKKRRGSRSPVRGPSEKRQGGVEFDLRPEGLRLDPCEQT